MNRMFEIVAGWSAGYQLALFLGTLALAGLLVLLALGALGRTLCILWCGYPPLPPSFHLGAPAAPAGSWQVRPLPPQPRSLPGSSCPATLRLYQPEETA